LRSGVKKKGKQGKKFLLPEDRKKKLKGIEGDVMINNGYE